ncbi:hypothetical protein HMPREF0645_0365 [Hallella bergensis DSM 17361]|uniref:Uncharacterized protein n=1 Tax=Hallella bergensis DSM 17361 TaxID=585502 RepID=D1PTT0_9BACT|nr:hypothetical protein HMPREF0645_0365 [Hallella bergensis DSM 17361]
MRTQNIDLGQEKGIFHHYQSKIVGLCRNSPYLCIVKRKQGLDETLSE